MTVLLVRPRRFEDARGWFAESWNRARFEGWGIAGDFCQDNHSLSRAKGTLRGIHFQAPPFVRVDLALPSIGIDASVCGRPDHPDSRDIRVRKCVILT